MSANRTANRIRSNVLFAAAVLAATLGLAPEARGAVVSSVQTGTATIGGANTVTVTVTITTVDPTRSILFFDSSHNSDRPTSSSVRGRLASATTLEFVRVSNESSPPPINIRWYVVEFASGVRVQRGEVAQSATLFTVPIAPVASLSQAFVLWSKTPAPNDVNNLNGDDPVIGELINTSTLQFRVDTVGNNAIIAWQVVEFTNAADIRVQRGSTSLVGNALTLDVTLPVAVDVTTTFVLVGYNSVGSGADIGSRMLRARLIDSTTIRIDRGIVGNNDDLVPIHWQAIDLRDGSEVLRGNASFATGAASAIATFGGRSVALNGAVAFASVQAESGLNMGRTPYDGEDIVGVCSVRTTLAPTFLMLERANTADACDVGWFVVQFAPTVTTEVTLQSFTATGGDGEVLLRWKTASELNNLGFHLYRSASAAGPWERITDSLVPGLGSSPDGAEYAYYDTGLENGSTWFYLLEDVETTGKATRHGPVSATVAAPPADTPAEDTPDEPTDPLAEARAWIRYGDPEATSLTVVERDARHAVIELRTGGFYALPDPRGGVWLSIPGFEEPRVAGAPALPVKLAWIEAVVGRKVRLASVVGRDVVVFSSLRPSVVGEPELHADQDGTISARVRRREAGAGFHGLGLYPGEAAQLLGTAFQGLEKKAQVELTPLRWDRRRGRLVLARTLRVRLVFAGAEPGEVSRGGGSRGLGAPRGKKDRGAPTGKEAHVAARLVVRERGLQAVGYEQIFGTRGRVALAALRLSRQGETVAHRVEPAGRPFAPGSVLYFVSEGSSANAHGNELVYELSLGGGGRPMPAASAAAAGPPVSFAWSTARWETDRMYQPGLVHAASAWLWDVLPAPQTKSYPLELSLTSPASVTSQLVVWLQGATDFPAVPDHHVRARINGYTLGETSWDGKTPRQLVADVPPGVLAEGANLFELQNVGDTAAQYSTVVLDWYELRHPRQLVAQAGSFEGTFAESGSAEIRDLPVGTLVVDTTDPVARWQSGVSSSALGVRLRVEAGRRYLAVAPQAIRRPEVKPAGAPRLGGQLRADYVVLGPREFLEAAKPLLELRQSQGLETMAVATEDVYDEFGFGEAHPEAVKAFLEHTFRGWKRAPRYVLLLGDASYDFKSAQGAGIPNHVPPYIIRDTYMWTVSDPEYASVNGADALPDLAIGRLPAADVLEAQRLVRKVVDWESAGYDLTGRAVLVADNADAAGDFEGDSEALAAGPLGDRPVERIYLSRLGAGTRPAIAQAFDAGASLMAYLGHGGSAVWASENVWNNWDVPSLQPQPEQPFLMAMDCLNGFFHHPRTNSLSEELLKPEGKGVVGTLAPSSLSVHWAANAYLQALTREIASGRHARLGDALQAAQVAYLAAGGRPDLLRTYQLLADPALLIRR